MIQPRWDLPLRFRGPVHCAHSEWLHNQAKSQAGQDLFVVAMTQGKPEGTWLELGCGHPVSSNNTYLLEKRLGWSGISIDRERIDQDIITPYEEYWYDFYLGMRLPDWPEQPVPFEDLPEQSRGRFQQYHEDFIARQRSDMDAIPKQSRSWQTCRPRTKFYKYDAFDFDFTALPERIDYLQVDLHPSIASLDILDHVLPTHRFSVITFEHDAWDHSPDSARVRELSRQRLRDQGYDLIISDATVPPGHGTGIGNEPINFEDWWADPEVIDSRIRDLYRDVADHGDPKYYYDTLFERQQ